MLAPAMSATILWATYSGMELAASPGKIRFMSRSNPGTPRVTESTPSGFRAGYSSTMPVRLSRFSRILRHSS